ncbi:hypothetical protein ACIO87_34875 [Streptomyces sp. NPDC087218]|uniref:hypothetical protein n=1 Tax=Streptomyces sp. NPDC087218 TaxID=3365769 RepID=UPI003806A7CE
MTSFHHSVVVRPLEPGRLRELIGILCDFAESTRAGGGQVLLEDGRPVAGVRLLKGRHLRPGARYGITAADSTERTVVLVREWRRTDAIAVEQLSVTADLTARMALRLSSPDRPRLVEAEGKLRGPEGSGALHRGTGRVRLDLAAWWAAAGLPPGAPPVTRAPMTARLGHRLGEARLRLRPRRADGGLWQVDVSVTVRGRWLLRPVVAVALAVAGGRVRQGFRSAVERAADGWNKEIGELLALDPDELRAELAKQSAEHPHDDAGRPPR